MQQQTDDSIAISLDTVQGRITLATSMNATISAALGYQSIGRKLLMVDDIPQGALSRYERDVQVNSYVISRRANAPVPVDDSMSRVKNYMMKWINNDQNAQR